MPSINMSITAAVIFLVIVGLVVGYIMYKWECENGACVRKFNGQFPSQEACTKACGTKVSIPETPSSYNCVVGNGVYSCQPSENGVYTSQEACQSNCPPRQEVIYRSVPVVYPAWRRWGWRGPWRRV